MLFALTRRHCLRTVPAGDPSASMAGGAWGSSDPPVNCLMSSGLAATYRPPPAPARWRFRPSAEENEMNPRPPQASRSIHTVVNEAANDGNAAPDLSTFLGCLKRIRDGDAADGLCWPEPKLLPGRAQDLARVERAAVGMLTVAEMLHAAERCRVLATPDRHLDEGVVDGMLLACRGLAELVCRDIRPQ